MTKVRIEKPDRIGPTTPLAGLRCLILDTETTGLQVDRARVISVGALRLDGGELEPGGDISFLINPGEAIPAASSKIHGLYDEDLRTAGRFEEAIGPLVEATEGRVVVGHNTAFDLTILTHEFRRAGLDWEPPPALDVGLLAKAVNPQLPDGGLETVGAWLGVEIVERHTALGDARTTAQIYQSLLPKLLENGVRTLVEADRFVAEKNDEGRRQQVSAGWITKQITGDLLKQPLDTFLYRHRLSDLMRSPPVFAPLETKLSTAIRKMEKEGIGALLVGTPENAAGILTERDILRALSRVGLEVMERPISEAMTSPLVSLLAGDPVYRAVARLQRLGFRHLPVTGGDGQVVGVVSARDLLRRSASAALILGDEIATAQTIPELARAFAKVAEAAGKLRAEELPPRRIASLISDEVGVLTLRAAELAVAELPAAPGQWSLMVLGSAGRGESLLVPDQDNALIFEDCAGMAEWAASFGRRLNEILDAAGLKFCKGGVMAGEPDWCHTPAAWRARVAGWIEKAQPQDLLNVDIFFDLRYVAGCPAMVESLYQDALSMAHRAPAFAAALNLSVAQPQNPLGFFGRLRGTDGRIDIKASGLLPIVSLARAAALHHGIVERSTPGRLRAVVEANGLPEGDGTRLDEMHEAFVALAMDQQIADIDDGRSPSYNVELRRLDRRTRKELTAYLSDLATILSLAWSTLSR